VSKKPNLTPYDQLKEYVADYVKYMEKIGKERMKNAEKEFKYIQGEMQAFNLLRQNIHELETNGVS